MSFLCGAKVEKSCGTLQSSGDRGHMEFKESKACHEKRTQISIEDAKTRCQASLLRTLDHLQTHNAKEVPRFVECLLAACDAICRGQPWPFPTLVSSSQREESYHAGLYQEQTLDPSPEASPCGSPKSGSRRPSTSADDGKTMYGSHLHSFSYVTALDSQCCARPQSPPVKIKE